MPWQAYQETGDGKTVPVDFAAGNVTNRQIAQTLLMEWRGSDIIEDMQAAQAYYLCRNLTISKKSRDFMDAKGKSIPNPNASNVRIPSAFLRTSVNQKANYAVGKPFMLQVSGEDSEIKTVYQEAWKQFIDASFREVLKRAVLSAVNKGIAWFYVWIDERGALRVIDVAGESIYPAWADAAHKQLDALVRDYQVTMYTGLQAEPVQKVEYWDAHVVERFIDNGEELLPDGDETTGGLPNSHMVRAGVDGKPEAVSWGAVPFIPLKGNADELPLLNMIRPLVDAYDTLTSRAVDSLIDDIDPVLVVEDIAPELGSLVEARELVKNSRIMSLDSGGKAYYLQVKADITAIQSKLEHLRKDIHEFSASVETQDIKMGSNPSGIALQAMYQDLDVYINGLEVEFEAMMLQLKYFFDRWLAFRGVGSVEQWEQFTIIVTFNRDMMINEAALIESTVALAKTGVSQETIDTYNPAVESFEVEEAQRKAQRARELAAAEANSALYQFLQQTSPVVELPDDSGAFTATIPLTNPHDEP